MHKLLPAATAALLLAVPSVGLAGKTATAGDQTLQIKNRLSPARASKKGKPRAVALHLEVDYESLNEGAQIKENTKTVVVSLPAGTKLHTANRPKCVFSQLLKDGPTACPEGSKVGQGTATADARPAAADPIAVTVTLYNGTDDYDANGQPTSAGVPSLLFSANNDAGVHTSLPFDIKKNKLELDYATPAEGSSQLFHLQKVDITLPKTAKPYVTAPVKCVRTWLTTMSITNFDGPTVTATDKQKCAKA